MRAEKKIFVCAFWYVQKKIADDGTEYFFSFKLAYRYTNFFWHEENPPKMQSNGSLLSWLKVVSLFLFHFEFDFWLDRILFFLSNERILFKIMLI